MPKGNYFKKCTHNNKIVLASEKTLSCEDCMKHDLTKIINILAKANE
ncbi:hypothetical protein [Mycoplasma mycoides]|uniref:Uncharacterized protein n=1 Tax=Mycoplasma mycoides subsp. capri TaxID=40477 RepID=A0AB38GEN1_MYCMC|nr:hypothetical protein [Mycoplasma mycoides]SRX59005.1 hypothetical protein MMC68K_00565 [Mycoplasma mycoides subsp. capri]SRX61688.1 hypothetical protein MMC68I_00569 [Mycoplasma mycoides subsp. capri]SRX63274.1 hypothetical protein MMC68N_00554 [Mycoplasma mycoides subsp. capri]SRX64335.1 hypothetical protein MMC68H_00603 [Mycoplasma mycoides subsp. capri]SRX64822.1 hypothetical protein MMC68D_00558 [Mycoplasma mycoides subsp. capri]